MNCIYIQLIIGVLTNQCMATTDIPKLNYLIEDKNMVILKNHYFFLKWAIESCFTLICRQFSKKNWKLEKLMIFKWGQKIKNIYFKNRQKSLTTQFRLILNIFIHMTKMLKVEYLQFQDWPKYTNAEPNKEEEIKCKIN